MGGVMGPQAWGLLVLGVLLACGQQIEGSEYYGDYGWGYSIRATIGIQVTAQLPAGQQFDACRMLRAGLPPEVIGPKCKVISSTDQGYYKLFELALGLGSGDSGYYSLDYILANYDAAAAESAVYGGKFVPGTLRFYDIDECVDKTNECSPNAACYNEWATYTCSCLDGYKDYAEPGGRGGLKCDKEDVKPSARPELDIEIWVYVLIAVAILVVLMLLICCCCCYSGCSDCCPSMHQARRKVIKHIKIVPQPVQAPCPPPPCICKPPEEKKIIIQVDQGPPATPAPAPAPAPEPMVCGPSAFIANSGYDGQVYIASPQAKPVQATRALPWADGSSLLTVNPPVQYIQQEPQQVQYIQQEPQQVQYVQQEPQQVQYVQQEPQQVQYVQQPQSVQYVQPIYDQPTTTPYVYNVNVDPSEYVYQ